ncbi:HPP family-domain-containing protein [Flammula alnicola]|nr:HPP family-domain-containing protein [Flammula alnicola]
MSSPNRLSRLPPVLSPPDYIIYLWSFIGAFCGISLIQAVFGQAHYFIERGVPSIVASYGATAVLIYGAIDAPLAQPRALFGEGFQSLLWLAGSLSCATSIVVMQITGTTHPPAGATALLAAVNSDIRDIGWYYLPVVLLTSTLALAVALITNNIQRRYPLFWLKPSPPAKPQPPPSIPGSNSSVGEKDREIVGVAPV